MVLSRVDARKSADPERGKRHLIESDFNQLLQVVAPSGTTTQHFDANGNQIDKVEPAGTTTFTWDARDRLTQVNASSGIVDRFGYDSLGLRVAVNDSQGSRRVLLDGTEEFVEYDSSSGTQRARFDHDLSRIDGLLAQVTSRGKNFLVGDALGSVYGLADQSGSPTARYNYDVYGARTAQLEQAATAWGFQGRRHETDFMATQHRARFFANGVGSWFSADPILPTFRSIVGATSLAGLPQTTVAEVASTSAPHDLSLFLSTETTAYGWPGSRPTSLTDPSGEIAPILVLLLAVLSAYALAIGIQWLAREVNPVFAFAICDVILSSIAVYFVALVFRLNPFMVTFSLAALAIATASVVCAQATQVNYNPQSGAVSNRSLRCAV